MPDSLILGAIIIIGVVIAVIIQKTNEARNQKVSAQIVDTKTGRTIYSGTGYSSGSAIADSFRKICDGLSPSSKPDTLKSRLDVMNRTLADNRYRMEDFEIRRCETYISRVQRLYDAREKERIEKEKAMPEYRRFVAQQRRLMTDSLRYDVMHRDNFRCQLCGISANDGARLHVDHIIPVSRGGKTEMSNLRTLCEQCNLGKGAKIELRKDPAKSGQAAKIELRKEVAQSG